MKCYYHKDADGKCCARQVYKAWTERYGNDVVTEFICMDYNSVINLQDIIKGEAIFIVDYSVPPEVMTKLFEITDSIVWIDHHKTAIEKYEGFERKIAGIRQSGPSGSILTYLFSEK